MNWLNYHHLLYFWKVAKEGSIARASVELRLAPPTISVQIHSLEEMLGQKLFKRQGRGLELTDVGRVAFQYADSIFATGDALMEAMSGGALQRALQVVVGISDTLPKDLVQQFLAPVFAIEPGVFVTCRKHANAGVFLDDLAARTVDVVLADAHAPATSPVHVLSHPLGECGTALWAAPELAARLLQDWPATLAGAPFLYPGPHNALRRGLDAWFDAQGVRPNVIAELDDAALALALAESGLGIVATVDFLEPNFLEQHRLQRVAHLPEIRQSFFAWSIEQKVRHPAVLQLCASARGRAFAATSR